MLITEQVGRKINSNDVIVSIIITVVIVKLIIL